MLILCNKASLFMQIVTLPTDFGTKDYYAAYLKGRILSGGIPVTIVDVTHQIEAYNIVQAAYMLRNAYPAFPKGTIHLLSVNNFYDVNPRFLAVQHQGHYFIASDNGVFSLLFDGLPDEMYELNIDTALSVQQLNELFAAAVGQILQAKPIAEIGTLTSKRLERISIQPIIGKSYIRGTVNHIDAFGNVILNIDRSLFERVGQGRAFELYFKRFDPICCISDKYSDQSEGEILCLFNSSGLLEIAVNSGQAASLFSLSVDDTIQIDFLD
jgi:S-adenosylmethionine hydrolase